MESVRNEWERVSQDYEGPSVQALWLRIQEKVLYEVP
jgi:hypothetical protein